MQALKSWLKSRFSLRPRRRRQSIALRAPQTLEQRFLLTTPFVLSDQEQLLLELVNRARSNPAAEASREGLGLNDGLKPGEITTDPKPPLAPAQLLNTAASLHAADMLARDYFSHTTLGTSKNSTARANDQGYVGLVGENLSWGGSTAEIDRNQHVYERHQSLFKSSNHRRNMLRTSWKEIGVSLQFGQFTSDRVYNASMAVQNFGDRNGNPYITGVVYADLTDNDFYDIGEAVRSGSITAVNLKTGQTITTTLSPSGGYALQVSSGEWSVEAIYSWGGLNVRSIQFAQVTTNNVKLDFERFTSGTPDQLMITASRSAIGERGADNTAILTITQAVKQSVPITVHLATDAPDAVRLPETVVIPAGELSVSVSVQGVEDDLIEPLQQTSITALVFGLGSIQTTLSVIDRSAPGLPASPQTVQTARPVIAWSPIANAASYEVWGDNNSSGQKRAAWAGDVTGTSWTPPNELALGNWTFYVRATTADGRRSFWSLPAVWQVRPLPTVLNSGRTEFRSNATIQWADMPGAVAWDVWVDANNPRVSQIVRRSGLTGNSFQLPELPVGRYTYWFRARNLKNEFTGWSLPGIITITDRTAGLTSPGSEFAANLQLAWNPLPGAASYEFWIDDRTRSISGAYRGSNLQNTFVSIPGVLPAALRVWVRARDFSGMLHAWSPPLDVLRLLPAAVTSPGTLSAGSPVTLQWLPVAGAVSYQLRFTDTADNLLHAADNIVTTTATIPLSPPAGRYRLWLSAVDSTGTSLQSTPFELQIVRHTAPSSPPETQNSAAPLLTSLLKPLLPGPVPFRPSVPPRAEAAAAPLQGETVQPLPATASPDCTPPALPGPASHSATELSASLDPSAVDQLFQAWPEQS